MERAISQAVGLAAMGLGIGAVGVAVFTMGWLGYVVAVVAGLVFVASLYDFARATTGRYRPNDARPAAWWSIWSGLVLAVVIAVWF